MLREDETFVQERIQLGGNQFKNCTFEDCRLVYDGSAGVRIENCEFEDTRLELVENAGNTLSFLQNVYHGFGEDGRLVVENFFDHVRDGRIGQPDLGEDAPDLGDEPTPDDTSKGLDEDKVGGTNHD